tara:strand:+ start:4648 stop:5109 length:462 start_codon:yes stop_codon:yes gene_type:complete
MLGGSSCKVGGKSKSKSNTKSGGSSCGSRVSGGAKKGPKKGPKKVGVKKRKTRGGGFCIGNLHPFEETGNSNDSSVGTLQAPQPVPAPTPTMSNDITGGAKKRKSKKTGKSRKAGPYAKFVKKHFASVQKKNPNFKAPDCIKELAKMWKAQKK